ncbi:hypothetical protein PCASD_17792 [Puccinia coronata f. sp. avenae]|uniref:CxC1-like cysteine cluster associated with KDZ transposases domain-containing protein n=1 Tax=Puccinia coronata f. sp. avenae TaxID=200324 RepID=A0A2N5SR08_9BASI|nr:hypothetical protein PCASD_17792 [Puccinia coronata f. sp. avenae]
MTLTVDRYNQSGSRAQRLRRMMHAERISSSRAHLLGQQRRRRQRQAATLEAPNEYTFHHDECQFEEVRVPLHQDRPDEWVTLDPEEDDELDHAVYEDLERWRQEAKDLNWDSIMDKLHAYYMDLKARTKNWTDPNSYLDFVKCTCAPHICHKRMVNMVDIFAQRRVQCTFCQCTPDAIRLLQIGFLPASPITPQTAFSLPLLIFHNTLWKHCHVGVLPFTDALREWLEPQSERLFARRKRHARELRKPFSAAVDLYRSLENQTNDLINHVLRLGPQDILASHSCPACFGPRPTNVNDYPTSTADQLIICLDGNFQHRHHSKASRDYRPLQTPRIFLHPKEITQATQMI